MTNNDKPMAIIHLTEGRGNSRLREGDTIKDFRGTDWGFIKVTRGPDQGRSAKIKVSDGLGGTREFYASVFPGLEVI